jgi:hypothetical protein
MYWALLFLEPKKSSRGRDNRQTLEDPTGLSGCTLISLSSLFFRDHKDTKPCEAGDVAEDAA